MNKLKLIQIISKDLEELKTLSEEIAENPDDSTLITDLALSRARLLCQELELLRSFSPPVDSLKEDLGNENPEEEDEASDLNFPDPELEILHFEEQDFPEDVESVEEEDEDIVYDSEDEEDEVDLDEDEGEEDFDADENPEEEVLTGEADEMEEMEENLDQVSDEVELEEHELEESDEDDIDLDEEDEEPEYEDLEEEPQPEEHVHHAGTKTVQPEVREMSIDELGDDEEEPLQFSPISDAGSRPVMHEIPKPEAPEPEKKTVSEPFQKERSLNDVMGEKKPEETTLGNGPIPNLRAAIGLNDRFLFIREIFNNNTDKFNTVIDQLDKFETIQQAVDYLRVNLTLEKNDTSLRFVDLLKRRFTK